MSVAYSLVMSGRVVARPEWANILRNRREELGIRQDDFPEITNELISQGTVSDIERGKVNPMKLEARRLFAYIRALKWTPKQFFDSTKLEPAMTVTESDEWVGSLQPGERVTLTHLVSVPYFTAVGGKPVTSTFDIPKRKRRPGTVAVHVEGDSMEPGLPEGDIALADKTLTNLREGHAYVFLIPGDGYTIKRVFFGPDGWEIHSDNKRYRPRLLPDDWVVVGEIYDSIGFKGFK